MNKKQIILKIISPPKKVDANFWKREYKILNDLLVDYPKLEFWEKVNFNQNWDSIVILKSNFGKSLLRKKYKEFFHQLPEIKKIKLTKKSGEDKIINKKPKTIRDFLSNE